MTTTPSVEGDRLSPENKALVNAVLPPNRQGTMAVYMALNRLLDAARAEGAALPCKEPEPLSTEEFLAKVAALSPAQYKALIFGNADKLAEAGITREWFERKAAIEGDLEVGAGWSVADALPCKGGEDGDVLASRIQSRIEAAVEDGRTSVTIGLPLARDLVEAVLRAREGREWFWRIVDADGPPGLPSDEEFALQLMLEAWKRTPA